MNEIVLATPEDIPAWLDLSAEVEELFGPLVLNPSFRNALERNIARGTALCRRLEDGAPGAPLLGALLYSPHPPVYEIGWLAVSAPYRRCGVASSLVNHMLAQVISPAEVLVTTFCPGEPGGEPALRFYSSFGFYPYKPVRKALDGISRQILRLVMP